METHTMRSPARSLLALIAALALLLNLTGLVAAARDASTGSGPGFTSYMAALGSHGGDARGKPGGGGVKNLQSNGGAVQQTPRVYISYWGPEWNTAGAPTATHTYADAMTYNTGFFANVGGSAWNQVVTQYCMGVPRRTTTCPSGATFITNPSGQMWGAWVDTTAVPSSPSQAQIAAAAQRLADHFGVSAADYANATFMVYTPSGKSMNGFAATGGSWCAWHSSTTYKGAQFAYA